MASERAFNWVLDAFSKDVRELKEKGALVYYIEIFPAMEYRGVNLLIEYYCGVKDANRASAGVGLHAMGKVSDVAEKYEQAIVDESISTFPEKLRRMVQIDEETGNEKNFYFKYWLDRIENPNFVDYRLKFHTLFIEYHAAYDSGGHRAAEKGLKRMEKEYDNFRMLIDMKNKPLVFEARAKRLVWNPFRKRMEEVKESAAESQSEIRR